jgi:hypothetical protein
MADVSNGGAMCFLRGMSQRFSMLWGTVTSSEGPEYKQQRGYIQKFPDWVDNETNSSNNKNSLRSNTKGYGGNTH